MRLIPGAEIAHWVELRTEDPPPSITPGHWTCVYTAQMLKPTEWHFDGRTVCFRDHGRGRTGRVTGGLAGDRRDLVSLRSARFWTAGLVWLSPCQSRR